MPYVIRVNVCWTDGRKEEHRDFPVTRLGRKAAKQFSEMMFASRRCHVITVRIDPAEVEAMRARNDIGAGI